MTQTSWLDSREAAVAHLHEVLNHPATKENNLELVNQLRAQSGDRPLTMTEYLDVLEKKVGAGFIRMMKNLKQRLSSSAYVKR
ncbi:hypothetical protein [Lacticaseibacillus manihotivorans]|uniref:hypothetical protein n=1 Tax=Lacticaseibacillus manihotivorans TaxID=88233 RepID=UPI0006D01A11|nr:hypothetical protein [Lacticaseibacillus manihotivorans]